MASANQCYLLPCIFFSPCERSQDPTAFKTQPFALAMQRLSSENARHGAVYGGENGKQSKCLGVGGVIHGKTTNRRPQTFPTAAGEKTPKDVRKCSRYVTGKEQVIKCETLTLYHPNQTCMLVEILIYIGVGVYEHF